MAFYHRNAERKRIAHDFRRQEEEVVGSLCRLGSRPISPKSLLEQEKRIRREIANSNERRRMQSINAGFQSLRTLLPHREGEKLSKAAILQNTADYIYQLEQEKTRLLEQNCQLKRRVINSQNNQDSDGSCSDSPLSKRKKRDTGDLIDEGIGSSSPARSESSIDEVKRELIELRLTLERERSLRIVLEEQIRNLESQISLSDNASDSAQQSHLSFHSAPEDLEKVTAVNMVLDEDIGSPESQLSNPEIDSSLEIPPRDSSPEPSISEVPEDLSGKNTSISLPCVGELSISDIITIPGVLLSPNNVTVSSSPFPVELEVTSQQIPPYKPSTSRQNLEAIVEAIRHVEGDHMFRDDPAPLELAVSQWTDQQSTAVKKEENKEQTHQIIHLSTDVKKELCEEQTHQILHLSTDVKNELCEEQTHQTLRLLTNQDFSFQHQIIRNAPITQSRPGVIVSNHS